MDDYRGVFDPDFHLGRLSRAGLGVLGREYQLAAHMQDRAGIPQVLARYGAAAMREIAILEWMGASPIYTQRIRKALSFEGTDVATIFKGMQFDVGAPHGFLDFRFQLNEDGSGEFTLPYCGALMDVEPMGDEMVVGMCHQIEDPTFDGTAVATNPRARMRPFHRPPRIPADRQPHCHWGVRIDPDAPPLEEIPLTGRVRESRLARLDLGMAEPDPGDGGGLSDYSGPLDPDLRLEDFKQPVLVRIAEEFCVQGHLLVRAFMIAIADRWGEEMAREITAAQLVGTAGLAAERIAAAMQIGDGLDAIAKLFQLHPGFHPRAYTDLRVDRDGDTVRCSVRGGAAFEETDGYSWIALVERSREPHPALDAIVRTVDPRARCRVETAPNARIAWSVAIDPNAEPSPEPPPVTLAKFSKGATFRYVPRRPPRA